MPIVSRAVLEFRGVTDLGRRRRDAISSQVLGAVAGHWHKEILPKHFSAAAYHRYGHKQRSREWRARKRAAAKRGFVIVDRVRMAVDPAAGEADLVFTGALKNMLMRPQVVRIFPSRAVLRMVGPRYMTFRPRTASQPDKHAEITTVRRDEEKTLDRIAKEKLVAMLNAGHGEVVRIKYLF